MCSPAREIANGRGKATPALRSGSSDVTVAEGNRGVLAAFHSQVIKDFTNDILSNITGLSTPIDARLPLLLLRLTRP